MLPREVKISRATQPRHTQPASSTSNVPDLFIAWLIAERTRAFHAYYQPTKLGDYERGLTWGVLCTFDNVLSELVGPAEARKLVTPHPKSRSRRRQR